MKKCDIYVDQNLSKKSMCLVNVFLNVNLLGLEFFFLMPFFQVVDETRAKFLTFKSQYSFRCIFSLFKGAEE